MKRSGTTELIACSECVELTSPTAALAIVSFLFHTDHTSDAGSNLKVDRGTRKILMCPSTFLWWPSRWDGRYYRK